MKNINIFFTLALFFVQFTVFSQQVKNEQYSRQIKEATSLIESWRKEQRIPGVQVAILMDGEIIWSQGFGYANLEHMIPVTPLTKMRIGSVSKTFTSAAVGLLMERGELDLDVQVQNYVSYFPEKKYPITTRQVAGHLAGIRHYRGDEFFSNEYYPTVMAGITIFANDTLMFKPGEKYGYSSYGYNLVSAIVEEASGVEFLKFMKEEVFNKLHMYETTADYNEKIIPFRTSYYALKDTVVVNAPYVDNSYKWAGGGFLSTCEDIVTFGNAFLKEDFLKSETIDALWASQKTADGKATNYGIGWASGKSDKVGVWYGHSGGSVGGITQFLLFPQQKLVLAMMANSSNASYGDLHYQVAGIFSQLESVD